MRRWYALLMLCFALSAQSAETASVKYPDVVAGAELVFPRDHGAHPTYRTEWWYVTGWLVDDNGAERGFQITFFRVRTGIGESSASRFAPRQLILAHAAVADASEGRLLHAERAERAIDPLSGAAAGNTRAWAGSWALESHEGGYRARAGAENFEFDLNLMPDGPPLLNGNNGFSQKARDPRNASYYYSRPQLAVTGSLRVRGRSQPVSGRAWLDHEWSSELLPAAARGWDWIGINLHDGGALMAFRLRDDSGTALWVGGTVRQSDGRRETFTPDRIAFVPQRKWRSPRTGTEYPVEWMVEIDGRQLHLKPLLDDQELDSRRSTGAVYWEGAVRVFDNGREIGRGYLEMTGYGERLRM